LWFTAEIIENIVEKKGMLYIPRLIFT